MFRRSRKGSKTRADFSGQRCRGTRIYLKVMAYRMMCVIFERKWYLSGTHFALFAFGTG
jgi:hypothetical protein